LEKKYKNSTIIKKSSDGNKSSTFHKLCDNKGKTLTLIQSSEGFIIGGYTPLDWDRISGWKNDNDTFLFSLTNKKIYKKIRKDEPSIYCNEGFGPWFPYIGIYKHEKKEMNNGRFVYKRNDTFFENINDIIPNEKKDRYFNIEEVEIYKISFDD